VNDATLMRCGKATSNLRRNSCGATWHERADTAQHGGEIFTVNEFHDDRRRFTFWCYVKDGGDVRMRNDCGGTSFGAEARGSGRRCSECATQDLYCNVATKCLIDGAKDESCSTFADLLVQPVASSNQVARLWSNLGCSSHLSPSRKCVASTSRSAAP
jgi:hypothetical protein